MAPLWYLWCLPLPGSFSSALHTIEYAAYVHVCLLYHLSPDLSVSSMGARTVPVKGKACT